MPAVTASQEDVEALDRLAVELAINAAVSIPLVPLEIQAAGRSGVGIDGAPLGGTPYVRCFVSSST